MGIYLDYNATTPCAPEVKEAIISAMETAWGNPSSSHICGKNAKQVIEEARAQVAEMMDTLPGNIIFTSGGTEANYMAIQSALSHFKSRHLDDVVNRGLKPHVISTNIEHDSVSLHLIALEEKGEISVTFVPVSLIEGRIDVKDIFEEIRPETCLITIMMANNETGIIQPISEVGSYLEEINRERPQNEKILFHTDAAQAIGKTEVSVSELKVDFLSCAGHKFYGPRIGVLFIKNLTELYPVFYGGGQERGYRSGTENTPMIAGLGKAAELINKNLHLYISHMTQIRDYLQRKLEETFEKNVAFNNVRYTKERVLVPRLPNTVSAGFSINGHGTKLLKKATNVYCSTGAACHSDMVATGFSLILVNSGVSPDLSSSTLRLSVGRETTERDIDNAINCLQQAFEQVK